MNSNHEVKSSNHQKKSKLWSSNTHSTLKQLSTRSFRENLVAKMKYIPNALKFGSPSRSGLLILNMIFGNCGSWPQNCDVFQGLGNLALRANRTCYLWICGTDDLDPKIIDSGKFCPNTDIFPEFYEICHSQQMEHANYKYNTSHGLKRLRDYWLRMIIGCIKFGSHSEHD